MVFYGKVKKQKGEKIMKVLYAIIVENNKANKNVVSAMIDEHVKGFGTIKTYKVFDFNPTKMFVLIEGNAYDFARTWLDRKIHNKDIIVGKSLFDLPKRGV